MIWWQSILRRWVDPEVVVQTKTIFLPTGMRVTKKDYLEACARIAATNDGKILIAAYQDKLLGALEMMCPHQEADRRLAWLAGHEMLVAVRKEMYEELSQNVELLEELQQARRLRGLRSHEKEDI